MALYKSEMSTGGSPKDSGKFLKEMSDIIDKQ